MLRLRNIFLIVINLSLLSFALTDNTLIDSLKKGIEGLSMQMPDKSYDYIKNVQASTNLVIDSVTRNTLNLLSSKYKLPKEVYEVLQSLSMVKKATVKNFKHIINSNTGYLEEYVGAGYSEDGIVKFAYLHIKVYGTLVPKYNQVEYQSCKTIIFRFCKTKTRNVQRGYTITEKNYVKAALSAYGYNYLKAKVLNVKSDSQLILTEDQQIYSLNNTKKVMVLENGQVFVGNSSFREQLRGRRRDPSPRSVYEYARTVSSEGRRPVPRRSEINGNSTSLRSGRSSSISAGGARRTSADPKDYGILLGGAQSTKDGPFNLELKLNGNLAVTNKKDKITWQTYTGNKGTAPYMLSVTEDGGLVVSDKNWKPLYDSTNRCNGYSVCLLQDYKYYSENGEYYVSIQQEGDILLYKERKGYPEDEIIWNTDEPTEELGPFSLIIDNQGNLKVISAKKNVVWEEEDMTKKKTGTPGPFKLNVTDNGILQVINGRNEVIWKNK